MSEVKERTRHPSTTIPDDVVKEIAYRAYLLRLDPPMTPEESRAATFEPVVIKGKTFRRDDATRRVNSETMMPMTRAYLRVLVDLGMVAV